MLRKLWGDPVWSKVFATAIVAAGAGLISYIAGWWPSIVELFVAIGAFTVASTPIPNWLLAVLILCAVALVALFLVVAFVNTRPSNVARSFRDYTEDVIRGVRWRWGYTKGGTITNLVPYCTRCDFQVNPRDAPIYAAVPHVEFTCDSCGAHLANLDGHWLEVENLIHRHIDKNIRDDVWRSA